jgi:hypothetical protein
MNISALPWKVISANSRQIHAPLEEQVETRSIGPINSIENDARSEICMTWPELGIDRKKGALDIN